LNRLTRNPIDSGKLSWLLQQGVIKSIQTIERQYLPSDNVLLFNVETGQANQYVLDLGRDAKRGLLKKLNAGWKMVLQTLAISTIKKTILSSKTQNVSI